MHPQPLAEQINFDTISRFWQNMKTIIEYNCSADQEKIMMLHCADRTICMEANNELDKISSEA